MRETGGICQIAFAALGVLAAAFAGCSTGSVVRECPNVVEFAPSSPLDMAPMVAALIADVRGTRVEHVSGCWNGSPLVADVVMKGDGETLSIVFLCQQMRMVTITLTRPNALRYERAPSVPAMFEPEYALADLGFTRLGVGALRGVCGGSLDVSDDGVHRRISLPGGRLVAEIERLADGSVSFRNHLHGYEYTIVPGR